MTETDATVRGRRGLVTAGLIGGTLLVGYLLQPEAPHWMRWSLLAALQLALGAVSFRALGPNAVSGRHVAQKMLLWPIVAAGLAGASRLAGHEIYRHLDWLAVLSLAVAHVVVEWLTRDTAARGSRARRTREALPAEPPRWVGWLLDMRWVLAITSVAWSWDLMPPARLAFLVLMGALFLWVARPGVLMSWD
jgi:hypothetical protein